MYSCQGHQLLAQLYIVYNQLHKLLLQSDLCCMTHDALMLLVSSPSVPIEFCNRLSNFAFLIAERLSVAVLFLYFNLHFHRTPLIAWACGLQFTNVFLVCMLFLQLSHSLLHFNENCHSLYLMHPLQVQQFLS